MLYWVVKFFNLFYFLLAVCGTLLHSVWVWLFSNILNKPHCDEVSLLSVAQMVQGDLQTKVEYLRLWIYSRSWPFTIEWAIIGRLVHCQVSWNAFISHELWTNPLMLHDVIKIFRTVYRNTRVWICGLVWSRLCIIGFLAWIR